MSQKTYTPYIRGSEWRKWDLHVHTKGTMKEDRFNSSASMEDFCMDMFRRALDQDIAVIGITDYFSIENYKKVKLIQQQIIQGEIQHSFSQSEYEKVKEILLIPNMEMRLRTQARRSLLNIHCLFHPDFIDANFNNYFLSKIEYSGENLTPQGLMNLGRQGENRSDLITDKDAYKKGVEKFTVDYEDLKKLLSKDLIRENCLVIIADGSNDGNSGLREFPDLRLQHLKSFDGLFTSNPISIQYYLGLTDKKTDIEIIKEFGCLKPCFHGSDAHTEEDLFKPALNRYCWIKADPTFEGLKQVIHEPAGRVKIQEASPDSKANHNVIDRIEISNVDIANSTIYFNPDLNVIIGGRSSGKSALLAGLSSHLQNIEEDKKNSYLTYIRDTFSLGMSVYFRGEEDPYNLREATNERVEYFPQNKFSDLAKNQEEFDQVVDRIVRKDPAYSLIEQYKNTDLPQLKSAIRVLLESYRQQSNDIEIAQNKIREMPLIEDLREQKKELEQKSKAFKHGNISEDDRVFYESKIAEKQSLENKQKENALLSTALCRLEEEPIIDVSTLKGKINRINSLEIKISLEETMDALIKSFKGNWIEHLGVLKEERQKEAISIKGQLIDIDEDQKLLTIRNNLSRNIEAQTTLEEIQILNKDISDVEHIKNTLSKAQQELRRIKHKITKKFIQYSVQIANVVQSFSVVPIESPDDTNTLKITTKLAYEYNDYIERYVKNKCDLRKLNRIIDCEISEPSIDKIHKKLSKIIKVVIQDPSILKTGNYIDDFLEGILLRSWFTFNYNVEYEKDSFHEMSEGKKSFVILKLILEFSDKKIPLLIDQPEDDLDNRAIFTELVAYLKEKKLERQIILVTHNANIVVNADSELVIVANQHGSNSPNTNDKKFEYIQGSIEHSFKKTDREPHILYSQGIKEHVCEIMEGGTEAFKKREQRYNIQ